MTVPERVADCGQHDQRQNRKIADYVIMQEWKRDSRKYGQDRSGGQTAVSMIRYGTEELQIM